MTKKEQTKRKLALGMKLISKAERTAPERVHRNQPLILELVARAEALRAAVGRQGNAESSL